MLAVISPSKTLDFESSTPPHRTTQPQYLPDSEKLINVLRKKNRAQLAELMNISDNLADLNYRRYRSWQTPFTADNARAALFAFTGDVYTGFALDEYAREDLSFAQKHLRILSGLYGVLRPLDLIQPYRLEMGTRLKTDRGDTLYEFWGDALTKGINAALKASGSPVLVNLASKEYFSALIPEKLEGEVITPQFKELKKDTYRIVSFHAKKARGLMSDYLIRERITSPEGLKAFRSAGYQFNRVLSTDSEWVFTRDKIPSSSQPKAR